ncbi:fumarate reductase subunit FrdD [uncultured Thiodictyon sp.]|uniref:fumarate reductase subunit FrdD n=1 Tax=uncultured Thiodictyon sp. TaxID=1846217 RepID=UPI0025F59DB8|nr:fumarate reductase subunit FrdD [uncultured Thiodictyon sp.]
MKRSNEPIFWSLFGAGGVLSALIGPVLIFITGIAVPLGFLLPPSTMSYTRVLAFAQHPLGKGALFLVISLFLFHGGHRMVHSLHDLGVQTGPRAQRWFYGFAIVGTILTAGLLLAI